MYGCEACKLTKTEEAGRFPTQVHEEDFKNKAASDHFPRTNPGEHMTNDEIRRRIGNWNGHRMSKDREEHCVTALQWR